MQTMTIGERLRAEIDSRPDVSYADVARAIKISRAAMSDILSGKTKKPKPDNLLAIADFLGLEIRWLITGQGHRLVSQTRADSLDLSALDSADKARLRSIMDALAQSSHDPKGAAGN